MKAIFSLKRHGYLKTVGVFLIAVALIAGIVGCEGEPAETYSLTMAVNPGGGGIATDDTGAAPYEEGEDVDISAVPAACYRFVSWSAPAGAFANANNATTTFTMPARDVTVTANFEAVPPDHFKFYFADWEAEPPATLPVDVELKDQFGTFAATVGEVFSFGNPVEKVHATATSPINDGDRHYTLYHLDFEEGWMPSSYQVTINNQFQDDVQLTVQGPVALAVPTGKEDHEMSDCLDHLLLYMIPYPLEHIPAVIGEVDLYDQFHDELGVEVYEPMFFANPVEKTRVDTSEVTPTTADDHYVFYPLYEPDTFEKNGLPIDNQFGDQTLDIGDPTLLAVPSQKIDWEQPLSHFKTYWVEEMAPIWEVVQLEDQFSTVTANVTWPYFFANPVEKQAGIEFSEFTPIWDPKDHLMFYGIDIVEGEPQGWQVLVENQFGAGQWLGVYGPIMVIVPTEKLPHGQPEDLNHFLVYEVLSWELFPEEPVLLRDQFTPGGDPEYNVVGTPVFFAVPAHKTVAGGAPTPIIGDDHLLFYEIGGGFGCWDPIVHNQFFGPGPIFVCQGDGEWYPPWDYLGVPSVKTWQSTWEP